MGLTLVNSQTCTSGNWKTTSEAPNFKSTWLIVKRVSVCVVEKSLSGSKPVARILFLTLNVGVTLLTRRPYLPGTTRNHPGPRTYGSTRTKVHSRREVWTLGLGWMYVVRWWRTRKEDRPEYLDSRSPLESGVNDSSDDTRLDDNSRTPRVWGIQFWMDTELDTELVYKRPYILDSKEVPLIWYESSHRVPKPQSFCTQV